MVVTFSRRCRGFAMRYHSACTQGLCARQDAGHGRILTSRTVLQDAVQKTTASSRCAPVHAVRPPCAAGQGSQDAETRERRVMASGDAQKVWFPEMIAMLRKAADPAMSVDAMLLLRDRLDATLQRIRRTRQILPAMMWCPHQIPPRHSFHQCVIKLTGFCRAKRRLWTGSPGLVML